MRPVLSLFLFVTLCGGCSGGSDDGGGSSGGAAGSASGGAAGSGGTAGSSAGGSGGTAASSSGGSGGTAASSSGGSGGAVACNCPNTEVCVVWCGGTGVIFKQECVAAGPNASCEELCGTDYPWNCTFSSCNGAPAGAKKCMGA
jgi:hypothetical protein